MSKFRNTWPQYQKKYFDKLDEIVSKYNNIIS